MSEYGIEEMRRDLESREQFVDELDVRWRVALQNNTEDAHALGWAVTTLRPVVREQREGFTILENKPK